MSDNDEDVLLLALLLILRRRRRRVANLKNRLADRERNTSASNKSTINGNTRKRKNASDSEAGNKKPCVQINEQSSSDDVMGVSLSNIKFEPVDDEVSTTFQANNAPETVIKDEPIDDWNKENDESESTSDSSGQ